MTTAIERAELHIKDAFRPERQERETVILSAHRVQALVEAGRYSFPEACRLLGVDAGTVEKAFYWLLDDNARLNSVHNSSVHGLGGETFAMVGWFGEQAALLKSNVVQFAGAA